MSGVCTRDPAWPVVCPASQQPAGGPGQHVESAHHCVEQEVRQLLLPPGQPARAQCEVHREEVGDALQAVGGRRVPRLPERQKVPSPAGQVRSPAHLLPHLLTTINCT